VGEFLRAVLIGALFVVGHATSPSVAVQAAGQEPAPTPAAVSLDRIRKGLSKPPGPGLLDTPLQLPVATFRVKVEQRVFVLTLEEELRKEFTLTALQRQSADWASKCCGLNLDQLFKSARAALQRREVRRIRQQIARELAQLETAGAR
jgi:hypothetical protein